MFDASRITSDVTGSYRYNDSTEKYMKLVLIPGDGIGPEVTEATKQIVAAAGARIDWVIAPAGLEAVKSHGDPLPESTLDLIRKHRVALKGPCTTPVGRGFPHASPFPPPISALRFNSNVFRRPRSHSARRTRNGCFRLTPSRSESAFGGLAQAPA